MTTRVDPAMYGDTPIFQALLAERKGRWPGIPMGELPPVPLLTTSVPVGEPQGAPPAMYRVQPLPSSPAARTRPYVKEFQDPEETVSMVLPPAVGD
jgi:hypothetical protein